MLNLARNLIDLTRAAYDELLYHATKGALVPDRCVIGQREHAAHDGLLVCRHHLDELGRLLRDIEEEATDLDTAPSIAVGYERSSGGLASEKAPARLDVIAYTDPRTNLVPSSPRPDRPSRAPKSYGPWCLFCDHASCTDWRAGRNRDRYDDEQDAGSDHILSALAVLHSWADNVRDDRVLTPAQHVTLSGERALLTRHLDWICQQTWVVDFHHEIRAIATSLKRANDTLDVPAGTCTDIVNGAECGGNVWHVVIKPDGKAVRASHTPDADDEPGFRCSRCRHVWTGTAAVRKRERMWRDEHAPKAGQR